jgi:hypothetical protein
MISLLSSEVYYSVRNVISNLGWYVLVMISLLSSEVYYSVRNMISNLGWYVLVVISLLSSEVHHSVRNMISSLGCYVYSDVLPQFRGLPAMYVTMDTLYFLHRLIHKYYTPALRRWRGLYCFTSVRLSFHPSVRPRYFSSHFSQ